MDLAWIAVAWAAATPFSLAPAPGDCVLQPGRAEEQVFAELVDWVDAGAPSDAAPRVETVLCGAWYAREDRPVVAAALALRGLERLAADPLLVDRRDRGFVEGFGLWLSGQPAAAARRLRRALQLENADLGRYGIEVFLLYGHLSEC